MGVFIFQKLAKYGGRNSVTALTGDGVGPELLRYVQEIFRYKTFSTILPCNIC